MGLNEVTCNHGSVVNHYGGLGFGLRFGVVDIKFSPTGLRKDQSDFY